VTNFPECYIPIEDDDQSVRCFLPYLKSSDDARVRPLAGRLYNGEAVLYLYKCERAITNSLSLKFRE